MIIVAALATLSLALGFFAWRWPLEAAILAERWLLYRAGLRKRCCTTPAGTVVFWEGGTGPVCVLLHGADDTAGAWARTAGKIIKRFTLVVPDLPGHGASEPHGGPLHVEDLVHGVQSLLDQRFPEQAVILVGNSLGAWVAGLYAKNRKQRVERLVFVNGGPLRPPPTDLTLVPKDRAQARRLVNATRSPRTPTPPGFVLDAMVRRAESGAAARMRLHEPELACCYLDGQMHELTMRVDLLWGNADKFLPIEYAYRMLSALPNAHLRVMDDCGHMPQRECAARFVAALQNTLAS